MKAASSSKDLFGNNVTWEGKIWKERLTSADPEKNINAWGLSQLPGAPTSTHAHPARGGWTGAEYTFPKVGCADFHFLSLLVLPIIT